MSVTQQTDPAEPDGPSSPSGSGDRSSRLPRALTPFRNPSYRKLAIAVAFTTFAAGVWFVGMVWEVIRIGGGPSQLSLVAGANALGLMVPALLAGVVADRIPQKLILIVVATVEMASMAAAAVLSLTDLAQLWHLAVISLLFGLANSFYYPAYSAWLPALVAEEDLLQVNGFEGMIRPALGQALGPAAAGLAVGIAAPGWAMVIAAASAAVALVALSAVPLTQVRRDLSHHEGVHPVRSTLHDIAEGVRYMVRTPWLLATLLFASAMILVMMGPLEVLVPFLIKEQLGGDAGDHAWVLAAFGVGGAVGSLAMASRDMPRRYLTVMNLMWGCACLPFAVYGFVDHVAVLVALAAVIGFLFSAPMVIWGTLLQRRVPADMLGRVSSLDFFVSISLMPVSMALAGPVSDLIGLKATFIVAGFAPVLFAAVAIVGARLPQDEAAHPLS